MLNLQRIRLLVEFSRRGTLADVADAMSYSRSSVSQQLSQLQVEVGAELIQPAGRGLRLTAAGEILVRHAEQILRQVERAEADVAATRAEITGTLKIATFQSAAISLIPDVLTILGERHPGLTTYLTEIQPDAGAGALLAGEFDLVLGELYPGLEVSPAGIEQRSLFTDPMRLWVGDEQNRWIGHQLADFADADWIFEPRGKPARAWAEASCRAAGFEPRVRFESADLLVHAQLVETGHAAALMPDLVWRSRPHPRARSVRLPTDPHRDVYTAVRLGAEARPALVELRDVLTEVATALSLDVGS